MEVHTETEQVLRPAVFWDRAQHKVVIVFQRFWITNQSHHQGSSCPSRTCLDSRQPAYTGCLLEQLTYRADIVVADFQGRQISLDLQRKAVKCFYHTSF